MWPFKEKKFPDSLENIKTEIGNELIENLQKDGWKLGSQYNQFMFDKGIDYDFYVLKKDKVEIKLEWDNWFEWKLLGPKEVTEKIYTKYLK